MSSTSIKQFFIPISTSSSSIPISSSTLIDDHPPPDVNTLPLSDSASIPKPKPKTSARKPKPTAKSRSLTPIRDDVVTTTAPPNLFDSSSSSSSSLLSTFPPSPVPLPASEVTEISSSSDDLSSSATGLLSPATDLSASQSSQSPSSSFFSPSLEQRSPDPDLSAANRRSPKVPPRPSSAKRNRKESTPQPADPQEGTLWSLLQSNEPTSKHAPPTKKKQLAAGSAKNQQIKETTATKKKETGTSASKKKETGTSATKKKETGTSATKKKETGTSATKKKDPAARSTTKKQPQSVSTKKKPPTAGQNKTAQSAAVGKSPNPELDASHEENGLIDIEDDSPARSPAIDLDGDLIIDDRSDGVVDVDDDDDDDVIVAGDDDVIVASDEVFVDESGNIIIEDCHPLWRKEKKVDRRAEELKKLRSSIAESMLEQERMFKDLPSHPFFAISKTPASKKHPTPMISPLLQSNTPSSSAPESFQLSAFPLPVHIVPFSPSSLSPPPSPSSSSSSSLHPSPSFSPSPSPSSSPTPFPLAIPSARSSTLRSAPPQGSLADYFLSIWKDTSLASKSDEIIDLETTLPVSINNLNNLNNNNHHHHSHASWLDTIQSEFIESGCQLQPADLLQEVKQLQQTDLLHPQRIAGSLWVDRFRPQSLSEWVGLPDIANTVRNLLFGDEEELLHHVLLHGALGVGKTTLVYLLAEMAGFRVIELSASDVRSGVVLQRSIEEATQSNSVLTHTFILMEDVDQSFATDKGFIPALNTLLAHSKRPIILTSSSPRFEPGAIGLDPLLFETVYVLPNQRVLIALRALTIFNQAAPPLLPRPPLRKLVELLLYTASCDLRWLINTLQLACALKPDEAWRLAWEGFPSEALGFPAELSSVPLAQFPPLLRSRRFLEEVAAACEIEEWALTFENYLQLMDGESAEECAAIGEMADALSCFDAMGEAYEVATTHLLSRERMACVNYDAFGTLPEYRRWGPQLQLGVLAQINPKPTPNALSPFRTRILNRKINRSLDMLASQCSALEQLLPESRKCDIRGTSRIDYASVSRELISLEEFRFKTQQKRRFLHYLSEFPLFDTYDVLYAKLGGRFSSEE